MELKRFENPLSLEKKNFNSIFQKFPFLLQKKKMNLIIANPNGVPGPQPADLLDFSCSLTFEMNIK